MNQIPENGCRLRQGLRITALALALSLLSPVAAPAKIFRCVADNGEITFTQTPCPTPREEEDADSAESAPTIETTDETSASVDEEKKASEAVPANSAPEPVLQARVEQDRQPENEAQRAQKLQADAREEEYRLQCEKNLNSQINNINAQMRADHSSTLLESLKKKRRALEEKLQGC